MGVPGEMAPAAAESNRMPINSLSKTPMGPLFKRGWGVIPVLLTLALTLLPCYSFGSDTPSISLSEAYRLALENNEDIRIAQEDLKQGRLLMKEAITVLIPRLSANAGTSRQYFTDGTSLSSKSWGLTLDQTLFSGGRTWIARKGAKYTLKSAEFGLAFARQSVLMSVVSGFYDTLSADRLVRLKEGAVGRLKEQLRSAQAHFNVGDVPKTDVLSARVDLSGAQVDLVQARKNLIMARRRLENLIGVSLPNGIQVPPDVGIPEKPLAELKDIARLKRADLRQGRELIKVSEQRAKLTAGGRGPSVKLSGSFSRYDEDIPSVPEKTVSLRLDWPFFQGGLVGLQAKEAYSRTRQEKERYGRLVKSDLLSVESALRDLEALKAQDDLVKSTLDDAEETFRLERLQFDLGGAVSLDVLKAQENLVAAEDAAVTQRYETRRTRALLLYSIGALDMDAFGPE